MKAFVSGEAATAVVMGPVPTIRSVYGKVPAPANPADVLRVFDGSADVRVVEISSLDALDHESEHAWAFDRGLRLFLFLLDPSEPEEELVEYAECVGELVAEFPILIPLKRRLAAAPLPEERNVARVKAACLRVDAVQELLNWLLEAQDVVTRVRAAFDSANISEESSALRERLTVDGSFLDVVTALMAGQDLTFTRLEVLSRHRQASTIISQWFNSLQGDLKRLPKTRMRAEEPDEFEDWDRSEARQPSYAAFSNVMAQQRAIVARLMEHDVGHARRLMAELVASQRHNSTPDQLAKSLSKMARQAGNYDIPELALEWAREATEANQFDPMSHGHLANALMDMGSYSDAETALNEVEKNGDPLFAATGRARILRAQGRLTEAREAFLSAADAYKALNPVHARLGAAEALRELGDVPGALREYRKMSIEFPLEPNVWTGLASTLIDLGDINEALKTYSKAATYDSVVADLGRARAFRAFGDLDKALAIFDEVLATHPRNVFALCGRGDVLRDQGKLDLALDVYEKAMELSPYRVEPILGKIHVLRHMASYEEALGLYAKSCDRFPYDRKLAAVPIIIYRAQGRFADALSVCDVVIARFPFDVHGRLARAGILGRLGELDEAAAAYDSILAEWPRQRRAMLGKAAILLRTGRRDEAAQLLPNEAPRSRGDWHAIPLRVAVLEARLGPISAASMLSRFISECPFSSERRHMRDLLAIIQLRLHRWPEVRRMVESHPNEVSNVISLHVYAATHRPGKAREWLERIRAQGGPADVICLADEIARRHELTSEAPERPLGWIESTQREILLADAA